MLCPWGSCDTPGKDGKITLQSLTEEGKAQQPLLQWSGNEGGEVNNGVGEEQLTPALWYIVCKPAAQIFTEMQISSSFHI